VRESVVCSEERVPCFFFVFCERVRVRKFFENLRKDEEEEEEEEEETLREERD